MSNVLQFGAQKSLMCFSKLILKYDILGWAFVNGIVFLVLVSTHHCSIYY